MKKKKEPSPFTVLWGWAEEYHRGFLVSVALAAAGVACNMAAYTGSLSVSAGRLSAGSWLDDRCITHVSTERRENMKGNMKKLSEADNGEQGVICEIQGDTRFLSRVTSIGLTIGCPVTVLQNEKKHPVLLYSRDTMVALNREECERIQIGGEGK